MPVSRAMRRLLRVRELEEEQRKLALESAVGDLHRLESALVATGERDRRGRSLVSTSAQSGQLPDRLAGIEETCTAIRFRAVLEPRIADEKLEVDQLREEYIEKRVERRQAETLIRETEELDAMEAGRRNQQALDDWFGNRQHHLEALADQSKVEKVAHSLQQDTEVQSQQPRTNKP
jgi:hypothetical protein